MAARQFAPRKRPRKKASPHAAGAVLCVAFGVAVTVERRSNGVAGTSAFPNRVRERGDTEKSKFVRRGRRTSTRGACAPRTRRERLGRRMAPPLLKVIHF